MVIMMIIVQFDTMYLANKEFLFNKNIAKYDSDEVCKTRS